MLKYAVVILVTMLALSSFLVGNSAGLNIAKPSVPEFNLRFMDYSYTVQPISSIDPYTGKSVVTQNGSYALNMSVVMTIENQPFTPYKDANGNTLRLYYEIRSKGHYQENWTSERGNYQTASSSNQYLKDPNATTTVLIFGLGQNNGTNTGAGNFLGEVPVGGQVDFKVQACIGYYATLTDRDIYGRTSEYQEFTGEPSGWSGTQTVTIGDNSTIVNPEPSIIPNQSISPSKNPTETPNHPISGGSVLLDLDWEGVAVVVLLGAIVVLLAFGVVFLRKRSVK